MHGVSMMLGAMLSCTTHAKSNFSFRQQKQQDRVKAAVLNAQDMQQLNICCIDEQWQQGSAHLVLDQ
jgi:hypothetical protein